VRRHNIGDRQHLQPMVNTGDSRFNEESSLRVARKHAIGRTWNLFLIHEIIPRLRFTRHRNFIPATRDPQRVGSGEEREWS